MPRPKTIPLPDAAGKYTREALEAADQFALHCRTNGQAPLPSYKPFVEYCRFVIACSGERAPQPAALLVIAMIEFAFANGLPPGSNEIDATTTDYEFLEMILDGIEARSRTLN